MARGALAQGVSVGTSETEIYQTATQLDRVLIQKLQFVNSDGVSPVTINVWITPDAATPTSEPLKIIDSKQVGVGDTYVAIEGIGEYINTGGKLIAQGNGAGVTAWLNGNTFKTGG